MSAPCRVPGDAVPFSLRFTFSRRPGEGVGPVPDRKAGVGERRRETAVRGLLWEGRKGGGRPTCASRATSHRPPPRNASQPIGGGAPPPPPFFVLRADVREPREEVVARGRAAEAGSGRGAAGARRGSGSAATR